ncbi:DUF6518 family protein [Microbacterium sp. GXF7504]
MTALSAPGLPASVRAREATGVVARLTGVIVLSFMLGALTSYGQWLLPAQLVSIANSVSGWTVVLGALLSAARLPAWLSAIAGAAGFALLTAGYAVASGARGFGYDPTFFVLVGLIAGPVVGVAVAWVRTRRLRAALATAVLAGLLCGEALYGLTVVADTTSPVYWWLAAAAGVALLVVMVGLRLRGLVAQAVAIVGTVAITFAFPAAYLALGAL